MKKAVNIICGITVLLIMCSCGNDIKPQENEEKDSGILNPPVESGEYEHTDEYINENKEYDVLLPFMENGEYGYMDIGGNIIVDI